VCSSDLAPPIGQITNGIDTPNGIAVDRHGNLYVANHGNSTVTVYPRGSASPSITYSTGLQAPFNVAVGNDGTVYVACGYSPGFLVEYPPGRTRPSRTISMPNTGPSGIALDASNNLYIVYQNHSTFVGVYKYSSGSGSLSGTNLGLSLPEGYPQGLAFDRAGDLLIAVSRIYDPWVVYVYPPGSKTFSRSITAGHIGQPSWLALDRRGQRLFLVDGSGDGRKHSHGRVLEYRFSDGKLLTSESQGVASTPSGVAVDPPEQL
jgi:sugar lactone lactonase YvrE